MNPGSSERNERRCWKIDWKIEWLKEIMDHFNSCHGHIFIIFYDSSQSLWLLAISFKTSHLEKLWLLKESSETSHLKNCDFWKWIFQKQSLVIDYHKGVIDYTSTDVTLHFEFWKS